jgi:hypothetical protein
MNALKKKTIIFFTISIFASLLIYIIIPTRQNIRIPVLPKPELLFLNKELVNLGFENQVMIKYFENNYLSENQKQIEANLLKKITNRSEEDQNLEELSALELIEIFFYKNITIYANIILKNIVNDKNTTERERKFFENTIITKKLKINPEDGSAKSSIISFLYSNKESYNEKEILILSEKINVSLSDFYFKFYHQLLSNKFDEVEKHIFLAKLRNYEQDIKSLSSTQGFNQTRLDRLLNDKINLNQDFLNIKKNYNTRYDKSYLIKSINYKSIEIYYTKSYLKIEYFMLLLILLNIIFYSIFIIFFRNGFNSFIKKYYE